MTTLPPHLAQRLAEASLPELERWADLVQGATRLEDVLGA